MFITYQQRTASLIQWIIISMFLRSNLYCFELNISFVEISLTWDIDLKQLLYKNLAIHLGILDLVGKFRPSKVLYFSPQDTLMSFPQLCVFTPEESTSRLTVKLILCSSQAFYSNLMISADSSVSQLGISSQWITKSADTVRMHLINLAPPSFVKRN